MSGFFGQVQLPDWTTINTRFGPDQNTLLHNQALASDSLPAQAQANVLISQNAEASGSQDLIDRGTLRENTLGLAQRNPLSMATAASLPGIGGTNAVNSLSTMDSQTAASKLATLQFNMGLPQMPYGGGAASGAGGAGGAPSASPADNSAGTDPGGMAPGFINRLGGPESGNNPGSVNGAGYSGKLQFGTGRMTDLGMYQPAQGENPNGNTWQGAITVPGFGSMTHNQFLANSDAQRMAAEVHFKDIGQQIDATPGAQDFNRTGLAAVAHLGGVQGMKQFVATGGKYNPRDSNGTSLQDYYTKFSAGGIPAAQAAFGHPAGPLPADHPARGVQVASAAGTAGIPATANDAIPIAGADADPAPGSTTPDTPSQLQAKLAQMRGHGAAAPVPAAPDAGQPSAAVQGINQFLQSQLLPQPGAAAPTVGAPSVQSASPGSSQPTGVAAPAPPQVANAPRPVIPGSAIMTTAPFADQKFPLSEQGPSSRAAQQVPASSPQQSQAPARTNAPSLAIGDSIAVGVGQTNGLPTAAKVGANPAQVLQTISQMDPAQVQGRNIILSSGASNDPNAIGMVQQQIAALKAKGAASVQLLGVGDAKFPGANQQLAQIAQQTGATFGGPLATGADGVHPANYRGIGVQAAPQQLEGTAPQAPAQQQQAASNPMAGLPPGAVPIKMGSGMPYTAGAPAGYAWAQTPDRQMVPYPLVPPVLKQEKTPDAILNIDPRSGQVVGRTPITETGRMVMVETPTGHQGFINGHPVGDPVPFSGRPEQNEAYKADQKTAAGISSSGMAAQSVMPRLNEMAQLGGGLQTGLGGEFRSKMQAVLEQMGANPADAAKLTGISSAADADEYRKLAISTAGTAAKADMGANNGVEAMRLYQSANPGMNLQPDANKRITNMLRVQQQSVQDYAQAASQHFGDNESKFLNGGTYAPLTAFNRAWQAQANPQVYAAATGILNGDPYAKWAGRLGNGADAMRAASIAARVDPNVMVPIAGGKMQPAKTLLGSGP